MKQGIISGCAPAWPHASSDLQRYDPVLAKPCTPQVFLAAVESALARAAPDQSTGAIANP